MKSWVDFYCNDNNKELKKLVNKILISNFGWVSPSEYDDFYSLAAQVVWNCEQRFSDDKNTSFNTYLTSCLIRKIKTRITYMNRDKRKHKDVKGNLIADISYEELIDDGVMPDALVIYEEDKTEEYSDKMVNYLKRLSKLQKQVLFAMSEGYSNEEIKRGLNISSKELTDVCTALRSYRNASLLYWLEE